MCFSATVSYSAAVVLVSTGVYAVQLTKRLPASSFPYRMWALVPVLFGVQQAFEGAVWQALNAGDTSAAVPFALGFHFFSHFLWLWWLPLSSYLVEPGQGSQPANKNKQVQQDTKESICRFRHFRRFRRHAGLFCHPPASRMDDHSGERTLHCLQLFRPL